MRVCRSGLLIIGLLFSFSNAVADVALSFKILGFPKDSAVEKNAQARLAIQLSKIKHLTPEKIETLYENAGDEILTAIKPYGYFDAVVLNQSISHKKDQWTATFVIHPGKPLSVTTLNVTVIGEGKNDSRIRDALKKIPLHQGQLLNIPDYNKTKSILLNSTQDTGYIQAAFSKDEILIDLNAYTCTINLTLNTGPQFYFGETRFNPNPLSSRFLLRYLRYKQGDPFSSTKLLRLQNDLSGGDYFKDINVVPEINRATNHRVPINVQVTPLPNIRYQIGAGVGTDSGVRMSGGILWRHVNDMGHKINLSYNVSQVIRDVSFAYIIPGRNPSTDQYTLNAAIYKMSPPHGWANVEKIGVGYVTRHTLWTRTLSLNYLWETYRIRNSPPFGPVIASRLLLPIANWTWLSTDKLIHIDHGTRVSLQVEGSYKQALSTVSFLQGDVSAKTVQKLWGQNRIVLRGELGYTTVDDYAQLPLSERFYTGGPESIRGYTPQGLGPGRYLTTASAEFQPHIKGNWFGAMFFDTGNAFDDFSDDYAHNLRKSVGAGVVWQSPIGNISVYLAKGFAPKSRPIRFMFTIGPEL